MIDDAKNAKNEIINENIIESSANEDNFGKELLPFFEVFLGFNLDKMANFI